MFLNIKAIPSSILNLDYKINRQDMVEIIWRVKTKPEKESLSFEGLKNNYLRLTNNESIEWSYNGETGKLESGKLEKCFETEYRNPSYHSPLGYWDKKNRKWINGNIPDFEEYFGVVESILRCESEGSSEVLLVDKETKYAYSISPYSLYSKDTYKQGVKPLIKIEPKKVIINKYYEDFRYDTALQLIGIENDILVFQKWSINNKDNYYKFYTGRGEPLSIFASTKDFEKISTKKEIIKLKLSKIEQREKEAKEYYDKIRSQFK